MADSPSLPDFSAPEAPSAVKITGWANRVFWIILASPLAVFLWSVAALVLIAWSLTVPLRSQRPTGLRVVIVIAAVVVGGAMGYATTHLQSHRWFSSALDGRPRFAPLESPGRRLLGTMGRCISRVRLSFTPEDERVMKRLAALSYRLTEEIYRTQVVALHPDADWPKQWANIQNARIGDVTFGEAGRSGLLPLFLGHHTAVVKLITPFVVIFYGGSTLLLTWWVRDRSPLTLVQFTLLMGAVVAAVTFVNFTVALRIVWFRLDGLDQGLRSF